VGFFVCQTLNNKGGNKEEFLALLLRCKGAFFILPEKRKAVKQKLSPGEKNF